MIHPMHGPTLFKIGVFSLNADGGLTLTKVPERWTAAWPDIVAAAQIADRTGLEFILPIARWKYTAMKFAGGTMLVVPALIFIFMVRKYLFAMWGIANR